MSVLPLQAKNDFIIGLASEQEQDQDFDVVDNQNKQKYIKVLSAGDDVTSCKEGAKIIPLGTEFQAFVLEGVTYIVIRDEQVLGVFNA